MALSADSSSRRIHRSRAGVFPRPLTSAASGLLRSRVPIPGAAEDNRCFSGMAFISVSPTFADSWGERMGRRSSHLHGAALLRELQNAAAEVIALPVAVHLLDVSQS